jgi:hypothetical protein
MIITKMLSAIISQFVFCGMRSSRVSIGKDLALEAHQKIRLMMKILFKRHISGMQKLRI